ncbi:MAG: VIT1/CCC1 transporter family protein [Deltaproteobacteria bacterium]|nr:VIT1/CCC1 transporter family protein [Deltaproteobacteria bacterium]
MSEAAHTHEHLEHLLRANGLRGQFLADGVLGATDGIVTTFAVVAGAAGAYLSPGIVIIMGFANLLADGFSMSVGNYLGARSQQEYWKEERRRESWEIENLPEAEREEVRRLYRHKGFEGEALEHAVETITRDKDRWLEEMMREELGIQEEGVAPIASGLVTFAAFVLAGFLPLWSYVMAFWRPSVVPSAFPLSVAITGVALFGVGAARRFMIRRPWWLSGLEILAVGGLAAAGAFFVGYFLRALLG